MSFLKTQPENTATGEVEKLYKETRDDMGYIPNFVKAFSHRPEVMASFNQFLASIRDNMDLRRYELVTLAAAKEMKNSYCMLAHGSVVLREFHDAEDLTKIANDPETAPLSEEDRAIMAFAAKVVRDASSTTEVDVEMLRAHGLSDAEIFDITAAASARCFMSKVNDATGTLPDELYNSLDPALKDALTVGRPISE